MLLYASGPCPRLVISYATYDPQIFEKLKGYFDLLINTLSVEIGWNQYLNLLALDGTMVVVGLPEKKTPSGAASLINARRSVACFVIGGIQ
jgi:uncharacterized zinc-type alcohol dehydrogenase-like protein